jgi:hypothetical protein
MPRANSVPFSSQIETTSPCLKSFITSIIPIGRRLVHLSRIAFLAPSFTIILPRTFVESMTNWFAGFEAFRRESSGLIVNCIIPSFITLGVAKVVQACTMPKGTNMASCWADSSLLEKASDIYTNANSPDKTKATLKEILGSIEGYHGKEKVLFKDVLSPEELENYSNKLKELSTSNKNRKELGSEIKKLAKEIAEKTHVYENVGIGAGKASVKSTTVASMLEDSVKFFREYQKVGDDVDIKTFAQKSKKLVRSKSLAGLAIVLTLAISMQYINRWITGKVSGVKGAPIYDDFAKNSEQRELSEEDKKGLLKQKLISISSMIGVSLLSMMKKPSWNMLEFKGWFPTMDQARIISTTTFASRMAVADDKNELAETTARDIATFAGLYFLGDYAGKATATILEKKKGVQLLNDTKPLEKDANVFKRFWHWVKDVNIKSSDEVVSKTAESLKDKKILPNKAQEELIKKEIKQAKNLRSACQAANLGVSLILLGLIVPIWTRRTTKKKHAEAIKQANQAANLGINEQQDAKSTKTDLVKAH